MSRPVAFSDFLFVHRDCPSCCRDPLCVRVVRSLFGRKHLFCDRRLSLRCGCGIWRGGRSYRDVCGFSVCLRKLSAGHLWTDAATFGSGLFPLVWAGASDSSVESVRISSLPVRNEIGVGTRKSFPNVESVVVLSGESEGRSGSCRTSGGETIVSFIVRYSGAIPGAGRYVRDRRRGPYRFQE